MSVTGFWTTFLEGIIAFVTTHIDDFFLLTLLFAQAQIQPSWKPWQIWLGGYLGLVGLMAISLLGYVAGLLLPPPAIGLLGLIPVSIGIWKLRHPGNEEVMEVEKELASLQEQSARQAGLFPCFSLSPAVAMSAVFTFANGGDNISVYIPLFAGSTRAQLLFFLVLFVLMKGLWFAAAQRLSLQPVIAQMFAEQGERWVPWIFLGLGVWIFLENETWQWLVS